MTRCIVESSRSLYAPVAMPVQKKKTFDDYLKRILNARVYDIALETPLEKAPLLSERLGNEVLLKREDLQPIKSFKLRGAYNKMAHLTPAALRRGVIAASAGNHAQGVALSAQKLGCRAVIVMPVTTPQLKIDAVVARGAEVELVCDSYSDAYAHALELQKKHKLTFVHPFDDPDVIAGQGTVGMEILRQHQQGPIDAIFVAVGGGGLIAGVGAYIKTLRPEIKIIGVQTQDSDAMARSLEAGRRVQLNDVGLFSDGTAVRLVGEETSRITAEGQAITAAAAKLSPGTISSAEANRWFLPITARLDPVKAGSPASPEYDRLFGIGTDKSQVVIYAFFGVDKDENDPDDVLGVEAARFLRTILRARPNLRPTHTAPFTWLLDFQVDGKKLEGITYDRALTWVVDKSGYPAEVGADAAKIKLLRQQVMQKLAERWIYWDLPLSVKDSKGVQKTVTVELRTFYGYEDGSADARQHAQWRYLEAFWYGDVFLYNGHSHFGHGPLEPTNYGAGNWNDRYQIMMVNSCLSFNYYQKDFLDMKPGGSKNLETIVNGLPSWVWGGGDVLARFVDGVIGARATYADLLQAMRLDTPWGEKGYDPMRVVDGEVDNAYSPTKAPLAVTTLAPVYP